MRLNIHVWSHRTSQYQSVLYSLYWVQVCYIDQPHVNVAHFWQIKCTLVHTINNTNHLGTNWHKCSNIPSVVASWSLNHSMRTENEYLPGKSLAATLSYTPLPPGPSSSVSKSVWLEFRRSWIQTPARSWDFFSVSTSLLSCLFSTPALPGSRWLDLNYQLYTLLD